MNFQKQIQFSKNIKADGRLREFNFLKLNNRAADSYKVDVSDERGRRYEFLLSYGGENWKISVEGLPGWVIEAEPKLEEEILTQKVNAE